ncbi:MAG: hypothetical protein L0099_14240, partial [Acidobacteria bacterium]|nr:hypothetical protein [Acidobacteriota bacterium]
MREMIDVFPLLIDSALKSVVILGLAAAGAVWLRRGSAASRHLAWQLGLIGVLILPLVNWLSPLKYDVLPRFGFVQKASPVMSAGSQLLDAATASSGAAGPEATQAAAEPPTNATAELRRGLPSAAVETGTRGWLRWFTAVWVAGVVL